MADETETPKILQEPPKSNAPKVGSHSSRQQRIARRRFAIVGALFLPLFILVVFLLYQQQTLRSRLVSITTENQQLNQTLSSQASQLLQIQQDLAAPPKPVVVDDTAVRQIELNVKAEIQRFQQELVEFRNQQLEANLDRDTDWKVLEARYLLVFAKQKLQLEANPTLAITLLESADTALLDSGNSNVFAIRQAIAGELDELRGISPVDREGLFIRIGNLAEQVEGVDLLHSMRQNFENRHDIDSQADQLESDSAGMLDAFLAFLSSVFVLQEWEESPEAMLAPGQDTFIKQILLLLFEKTELALLLRDKELYRRSLTDSQEWMMRNAVTESTTGQFILAELEALLEIDIDPELPSLSLSLELIDQLTANER